MAAAEELQRKIVLTEETGVVTEMIVKDQGRPSHLQSENQ
jgi:hypothetical protein